MKSIYSAILMTSMLFSSVILSAQPGVGIGTPAPDHRLHIKSTSAALLKLENSTTINNNVRSDLYFNIGGYYTGAIKSIGTGGSGEALARLGLFTYAGFNPTDLEERISILDGGYVGIGDTTPTAPLSFANGSGNKIDFFYDSDAIRHGIGTQFNVLQIYTATDASNIVFGYGSSTSFTERMRMEGNGDVGIGTSTPDYRLHIKDATHELFKLENSTTLANNVVASQFFKTGTHYTGAIKTIGTSGNAARMGLFTFAGDSPTDLLERLSILDNGYVGIGTATPGYILDVNGRMRLKHAGNTSGLWLMNSTNTSDRAFVGLYNDTHVGFYGATGGNWNLVMNTATGNVGIGTTSPINPLEVIGAASYAGRFENTNSVGTHWGILGKAMGLAGGGGAGIRGEGSVVGTQGIAELAGTGIRRGIYGSGKNGTENNYGVYGIAQGGVTANGVYGSASGGGVNWGGYFSGDVYCSGAYVGSDRRLKENIKPLNDALALIDQLKPAMYAYKTEEYSQMQLPEGTRFGLIADEVKHVLPGVVKKAIQPAQYENEDTQTGRKLSDAVEFEAINYTEIIPILIGAIQEQQAFIIEQAKQLDEFKARLTLIEQSNK